MRSAPRIHCFLLQRVAFENNPADCVAGFLKAWRCDATGAFSGFLWEAYKAVPVFCPGQLDRKGIPQIASLCLACMYLFSFTFFRTSVQFLLEIVQFVCFHRTRLLTSPSTELSKNICEAQNCILSRILYVNIFLTSEMFVRIYFRVEFHLFIYWSEVYCILELSTN